MNTKKEKELPAAVSTAAIAHLRAVDAAGASVNATPAQIREMVGIDYSSLEEQEVTGEKWLGLDGVARQVYTTSVSITLPANLNTTTDVFSGVSSVRDLISVTGIISNNNDGCWPINEQLKFFCYGNAFYGSVRFMARAEGLGGRKAQFAIKYTKR